MAAWLSGMVGEADTSVDIIDYRQVKMARSGLELSVRELAELSGLNKATIVRVEAGISVRESTLRAIQEALESAGAVFLFFKETKAIAVRINLSSRIA